MVNKIKTHAHACRQKKYVQALFYIRVYIIYKHLQILYIKSACCEQIINDLAPTLSISLCS